MDDLDDILVMFLNKAKKATLEGKKKEEEETQDLIQELNETIANNNNKIQVQGVLCL